MERGTPSIGVGMSSSGAYAHIDGRREVAEERVIMHTFFVGAANGDRRVDCGRSLHALRECGGAVGDRAGCGPRGGEAGAVKHDPARMHAFTLGIDQRGRPGIQGHSRRV